MLLLKGRTLKAFTIKKSSYENLSMHLDLPQCPNLLQPCDMKSSEQTQSEVSAASPQLSQEAQKSGGGRGRCSFPAPIMSYDRTRRAELDKRSF